MTIAPENPTRTVADLPRPRPGWRDRSACLQYPAGWWDLHYDDRDGRRDDALTARAVCANCPVRQDCLLESLHNPDKIVGRTPGAIRGGYTPDERAALLDRRGIQRPAELTTKEPPVQKRAPYRPLDCELIDRLRTEGKTWAEIATVVDAAQSTAAMQWRRWKRRQDTGPGKLRKARGESS